MSVRFANVLSQLKQIIMSNFHPFEVVGRGSETQLQTGENKITLRANDDWTYYEASEDDI